MALITARFFAETLGMSTTVEVILPDRPARNRRLPVLYLLHGLSEDQTAWMRNTSVELFADRYELAIVMPYGGQSFYCNMDSGERYFDFIVRELPRTMEAYFPLAADRESRFIGGLSMGGWGAFMLGLSAPDRYAAVAGLSAVIDLNWAHLRPGLYESIARGANGAESEDILFHLADEVPSLPKTQRPSFFQYCGKEDFLWGENLRLRDHMKGLGLDVHWEEDLGDHRWERWGERIGNLLKWLPMPSRD